MKKYFLEIVVFVGGMGTMVFELVGSRALAPYVGTTVLVWSCLIGVILASLSLGYWFGGKRADKHPDYIHFASIIFGAAFFVALAGLLKLPTLKLFAQISDIRIQAILSSLFLFGPGSFFMAAISPYAVRLKLHSVQGSGGTVGNLSAIATAGSIFGAFFTGLFLVSYLSNTIIIFLLALVLFLTALLIFSKKKLKIAVSVGIFIIFSLLGSHTVEQKFSRAGVVTVNSEYGDIMVIPSIDTFSQPSTNRPVLEISTDVFTSQSAMFTDAGSNMNDDLVLPYTKFFRLADHFHTDIKKALMIGGAGYSYPKEFLKTHREASMDVVEIDPKMPKIAQEYFHLEDSPRLTTFHEDGRIFLNKNTNKYDAIFIDAFKSYMAPFQLTTKEAVEKISSSLADDGVVLVNIVSAIEGEQGQFLRAEYATYKTAFPQVHIFRVIFPFPNLTQNLMLVATKANTPINLNNDDKILAGYLEHYFDGEVETDLPVLVDDYAPVEKYMAGISK